MTKAMFLPKTVIAKGGVLVNILSDISFNASELGIDILNVHQGHYWSLGLPHPSECLNE